MNERSFLEAVNESPFLPDDLELTLAAKDYLKGKRMPVIRSGWPSWDGNFGFLWNQLTGIGGYANYGKGTFARQLMMQMAINEKTSCGIWCPEDMPIEYAMFDLVSTYTGLDTEHPDRHDFVGHERGLEVLEKMREMFFVIDSEKWVENSLDKILEVFERLYLENGVRIFLIDPYKDTAQDSNVRDDFRVHEDILKMRHFVQKYKAHLFVVLHLKRPTTKSGEDPELPTYNDLHYGSEWSKSLDNMLFYHHPTFFKDRKNTSRIVSIAKSKKRKIQGQADQFNMEWSYWQNRILDTDGKCGLPDRRPNVDLKLNNAGIPQGAIDRAHDNLQPIEKDELPF